MIENYGQPMFQLLPDQTVYICSTAKSICRASEWHIVFNHACKEKIFKAIFNINVKISSLDAEIITELILSGKEKRQLAQSANHLFTEFFPEPLPTSHPQLL